MTHDERRFWAAALILGGVEASATQDYYTKDAAEYAVKRADALLAALGEPITPGENSEP